ncbi:YolD-like family protein [Paenibacillus dauci]|uniref:YolD-like family protein n=1 Tax=Paenibacillus dauci TaxID=1567106 RepID=UPI000619D2D6|nr:YolD-like family protein [Paenibacillus dauci]
MNEFTRRSRDPNKTWSSAFILPEHRERLTAFYASQQDISRPRLDQQKFEELQYTTLEYLKDSSNVCIEYFNYNRIQQVTGHLVKYDLITKKIVIEPIGEHPIFISPQDILNISKI